MMSGEAIEMRKSCRLIPPLVAGLVLAFATSPAQALNYGEHAYLTYAAGMKFCDAYQRPLSQPSVEQEPVEVLCEKTDGKRLRLMCFAHMVAISGDYVALPKNLIGSGRSVPLKSGMLDCSTLTDPLSAGPRPGNACPKSRTLEIDASVEIPELSCQLVDRVTVGTLIKKLFGPKGAFSEQFAYVRLVSGNQQHFPPWSISVWKGTNEYLEGKCLNKLYVGKEADRPSRQIVLTSKDVTTRLIHAAFLFHFLEDSLPAGHMGSRRDKCHHDYDNALHDDYNAYGRFIRIDVPAANSERPAANAGELRYVYGDGGLFKDTKYVNQEALSTDAKIDIFVSKHPEYEWRDLRRWKAAISSGPQSGEQRVLSVPYAGGGSLGPVVKCQVVGTCRKETLVIASPDTWAEVMQRCNSRNEAVGDIIVCKHETLNVAQAVVEQGFRELFASGRDSAKSVTTIQDVMPKSYLSIVSEDQNGEQKISRGSRSNSQLLVVDFSNPTVRSVEERRRSDDAPIEPFTDIGFALRSNLDHQLTPDRSAMTFTVKVSGLPGSKDSAGFARTSDTMAVDLRFDVVDTAGKILNRSSIGVLFPDALNSALFKQRVIGITPTGAIGYANLWDGAGSRNFFGSVGLSLDMHVARHAFYIEVVQARHYNHRVGWWWGTDVFMGFRTLAISLDRRH
jgi:hypothetical protein